MSHYEQPEQQQGLYELRVMFMTYLSPVLVFCSEAVTYCFFKELKAAFGVFRWFP